MRKLLTFLVNLLLCISFIKNTKASDLQEKLLQSDIYKYQEWSNLLHYDKKKSVINSNSTFFLSNDGYKNPKSEYIATIKALFNDTIKDDHAIICKFPARINFISKKTNIDLHKLFPHKCNNYEEFIKKVPIDTVSIVFASENNISPSSMMGHTFFKLYGKNETGYKEHSFSYFATINQTNSLKFYFDVLTSGLDGAYILSPYKNKKDEYLLGEQRSLWEFDLQLTDEEKQRLKMHIWELKDNNIKYSLLSHNCNTAAISILKTANPEYSSQNIKPFTTPIEYIQELHHKQKIRNITIIPTTYAKHKIDTYGIKNILNASKSSRIDMSYTHHSNDNIDIKLSPVYQDIKDVNYAYHDNLESKIFELGLNYNLTSNQVYLNSIDILKMRSIIDYTIQKDYSKHFKLSLENNLGEQKTNLKPTIELGLGWGYYIKNTALYFIPKGGYRYNNYSNFYLSPEIGIISQIKNYKLKISYETFINSKQNNRGYNGKINIYNGFQISGNQDIYINYSHYNQADNKNEISVGISTRF